MNGLPFAALPAALLRAPARGPDYGMIALAGSIGVLVLCMIAFAAIAGLLRFRNRRTEREWLAREGKWGSTLLDVLSGATPPASLWARVEGGEELYFLDYLLRYARRTRGSTRHVLEELARPYLSPVVDRIAGGDTERRARAVETVAMLGFGPNAAHVVSALSDPSPLVSMIAARSIARQQRPEHVEVLLAHTANLSNWSPRQLTTVLSSLGPRALPALRRALLDATLPADIRAVAADALRRLHDPDAMATAERVLASATERDVLAAALRLVAELGQAEQAPLVRPFLGHDDPVIRLAAIQALATTGGEADESLLRQGMEDESAWVAIHAARALVHTGDSGSLRQLARSEEPRALLARQVLLESA